MPHKMHELRRFLKDKAADYALRRKIVTMDAALDLVSCEAKPKYLNPNRHIGHATKRTNEKRTRKCLVNRSPFIPLLGHLLPWSKRAAAHAIAISTAFSLAIAPPILKKLNRTSPFPYTSNITIGRRSNCCTYVGVEFDLLLYSLPQFLSSRSRKFSPKHIVS